jgi:sterol desaturase/sphingolipid hydroxylase (fatty acid hydroxylase superfamily)
MVAINVASLPNWIQYLLLFVIADFIQWWTHVLLHRVPALWEFHKVHHSVEQMGFAAHFRFHWFETIIYKSIQYIPLAMIGFGLDDFFIVYATTIAIGHLNHANLYLPIGPLKYIFNNPQMHIWHHAYEMPKHLPYGMNFGLSLSIWDYLFRKAYIPHDGRDIRLGFPEIEKYPGGFFSQMLAPFRGKS